VLVQAVAAAVSHSQHAADSLNLSSSLSLFSSYSASVFSNLLLYVVGNFFGGPWLLQTP